MVCEQPPRHVSKQVVVDLQGLGAIHTTHRHKVLSMQDNFPCACCMAKGRSPVVALDFLVRKKAATCIGANIQLILPWVQSKLQAADELSRCTTLGTSPA